MPAVNDTLAVLRELFAHEAALYGRLRSGGGDSFADIETVREALRKTQDELRSVLTKFAIEPPHHASLFPSASEFAKAGDFDSSVMIMTKYPDLSDARDAQQLQAIIDYVHDGISARGYKPRIAYDRDYHAEIWENVQQYLLGSSRGVAILQDKIDRGPNPNVALEMGWMLGSGRRVLGLMEQSYLLRADFETLVAAQFDWNDPRPGIDLGLDNFLEARHIS